MRLLVTFYPVSNPKLNNLKPFFPPCKSFTNANSRKVGALVVQFRPQRVFRSQITVHIVRGIVPKTHNAGGVRALRGHAG